MVLYLITEIGLNFLPSHLSENTGAQLDCNSLFYGIKKIGSMLISVFVILFISLRNASKSHARK